MRVLYEDCGLDPRDELEARDGGAKGRERLSLIVHCGTIKYIDYENISAEKKTRTRCWLAMGCPRAGAR